MKKINKKSITYLYFKLVRQSGSPESIARGVAIGLFVAFAIPFFFQMIIAFPLAIIFRAAKIPALACTWVTNYFTVPFVYPLQCYVGSLIMGHPFTYAYLKNIFTDFAKAPSFKALGTLGVEITIPFFVGGIVFGGICAFVGYFSSFGFVTRHRQKKDIKLRRKLTSSTAKIERSKALEAEGKEKEEVKKTESAENKISAAGRLKGEA